MLIISLFHSTSSPVVHTFCARREGDWGEGITTMTISLRVYLPCIRACTLPLPVPTHCRRLISMVARRRFRWPSCGLLSDRSSKNIESGITLDNDSYAAFTTTLLKWSSVMTCVVEFTDAIDLFILDFGLLWQEIRPNIEAELLKPDRHLQTSCIDETNDSAVPLQWSGTAK